MWNFFRLYILVAFLRAASLQGDCDVDSPYRTLDGSCNNLLNPKWGTPNTKYARVIPAEYGDGISTPRTAASGNALPNARRLSTTLHGDTKFPDPKYTLLNMQFGQIVAHDMGLFATSSTTIPCCTNGVPVDNPGPQCFAISVPEDDPVFANSTKRCLNLIRTPTDRDLFPDAYTTGAPVEQINRVTSFADLSIVYGTSQQANDALRSFEGGKLKVENRNDASFPPHHPTASTTCRATGSSPACYLTGDPRANQSPDLSVLQVLFMREHNRLAEGLQQQHPSWADGKLFNEARRINIAQYQYIVYYEWLPNILGRATMLATGMIFPLTNNYVFDYLPNVNPSTLNTHATAAFRYFHTEIIGHLQMMNEARMSEQELRLSDHFNNPTVLESTPNSFVQLTRGLATQPMAKEDGSFDPEVKHFLFRGANTFGSDLRSIDIQRARDHGIPSYNAYRQYCGLARATKWKHFADIIGLSDVEKLQTIYETVDDVEYTVAGFMDRDFPGSDVGWMFHCVLTVQFVRTRKGDRFFFENGMTNARFTLPQLREIRKSSIARILCNNTPNMAEIQPKAFEQITAGNKLAPCSKRGSLDFTLW